MVWCLVFAGLVRVGRLGGLGRHSRHRGAAAAAAERRKAADTGRPGTGTPGPRDLDHPFERPFIDTAVAPDPAAVSWINTRLETGETPRVLAKLLGKTGIRQYARPRHRRDPLGGGPTVTQNVVSAIDRATGTVTRERRGRAESQDVLACPIWVGGKDWESVYRIGRIQSMPVIVG
ncbi:MAG: hypothetical protein OXQ29_17150 [Rhodospirillaceae bacterium]|nr:hypothetical protein [Rhodospirillaceae bacterium]